MQMTTHGGEVTFISPFITEHKSQYLNFEPLQIKLLTHSLYAFYLIWRNLSVKFLQKTPNETGFLHTG